MSSRVPQIDWSLPSLKVFLTFTDFFTFDITVMRANCFATMSPAWLYACRAWVLLAVLPTIVTVHFIVQIYDRSLRKRARMALMNSAGLAFAGVYVTLVRVTLELEDCLQALLNHLRCSRAAIRFGHRGDRFICFPPIWTKALFASVHLPD